MKLAVQVVLYKSSPHLEALLASLKAQTFSDFELFFYDNSELVSEISASRQIIDSSGLPSHFFKGEKNIGFDGGHTALYALQAAPFVMLLNDDVKLEPKYLEAVMRRVESDSKIGSVTGLVYRWQEVEERVIDTAGLEYKCLAQIVDRFAGKSGSKLQAQEVFGVSGAIGLYRREAIEKAGGLFDPSWFMYKEDVDLALRLRKAGYVAWFEPEAIAWHKRGLKQATNIWMRLMSERQRDPVLRQHAYVNQWRIYKRHFSWSLGWSDILRSMVIEKIRSVGTFIISPRVFFQAWKIILKKKRDRSMDPPVKPEDDTLTQTYVT